MHFHKLRIFLWTVLAVLALASCKKNEESNELSPFLSGGLNFEVDSYIFGNTTVTMTPKDAIHPENKGLGYRWYIPQLMDHSDTVCLERQDSPPRVRKQTAHIFVLQEI